MLKSVSAILAAAFVAAILTSLTAPSAPVTAGPMHAGKTGAIQACVERPWPYLNCVGTPYGNPQVRLVTTDHL
jgi:hypothetical protein